jgi:3-hydroxyisobutyrate dehydrogenase-like beta-hydroxyacid dehydrogenase
MSAEQREIQRVGIIGIGEMGSLMVERMLAGGHQVAFYARRPEAGVALEALGAVRARSAADLAEQSDVLILCVFTDDQVTDVCLGPDGVLAHMRQGAILVNHTTGSPVTATQLAVSASALGVRFLDAALSGAPAQISAGTLTLLIGGDPDVVDSVRALLSSYSNPILRVGDVGDGQRVKLVNNALFTANMALVREAEALASRLGLDSETVLRSVSHSSGGSYALGVVLQRGSAAETWQQIGYYMKKDLAILDQVAADLDVDLGMLRDVTREPASGA